MEEINVKDEPVLMLLVCPDEYCMDRKLAKYKLKTNLNIILKIYNYKIFSRHTLYLRNQSILN
jgi:hypothetical protein